MRTTITISVVKTESESTVDVQNRIEAAFGQFDRIVEKFTRFKSSSELSRLNMRSGQWVTVSEEFIDLIERMLYLAKISNGAYDPTVIDFLEVYGYDTNYDFSKLDNPELDSIVNGILFNRPSWEEIQIDRPNLRVRLAPLQRIDLGGIGKGYAIDKAYQELSVLENFIIDAGGDTRAKGLNENSQPWKLGLTHKSDDKDKQVIGIIESSNIAIASSGSWARRVKQFHHLINPKLGTPHNQNQTVFVAADTAIDADGWATAIFVSDHSVLEVLPKGIEAMIIDKDEKVYKTPGFKLT